MQALGQDSALQSGATLSGIRALLVAPFAVGRYQYSDIERQELASLGPLTEWYAAVLPGPADGAGPAATMAEEGQLTLNGWQFAQTLNLATPGLDPARRTVLQALRQHHAGVAALVQDGGGRWWLLGQSAGLRLLQTKANTAPAAVGFALAATQPEPACSVDEALIADLFGQPYTPSPNNGSGYVELRTAGGRLLATVPAGQKIILKSGFKLGYTIQ